MNGADEMGRGGQLTCQARVGRKGQFCMLTQKTHSKKRIFIPFSHHQINLLSCFRIYQPEKLTLNKIVKRAKPLRIHAYKYGMVDLCRALSLSALGYLFVEELYTHF